MNKGRIISWSDELLYIFCGFSQYVHLFLQEAEDHEGLRSKMIRVSTSIARICWTRVDQMYRSSSGQTHERSIDHSMDAHGAPSIYVYRHGVEGVGWIPAWGGRRPGHTCMPRCIVFYGQVAIHEHTHTHTGVTAGYSSCCPVSSDGQCCVGLQITHIQPSSGGDELGSVYIS